MFEARQSHLSLFLVPLWVLACSGSDGGAGDAALPDTSNNQELLAGDVPVEWVEELFSEVALTDTGLETAGLDVPEDLPSGPCQPSCPEGYCDQATGNCLVCDEVVGCLNPNQWCKDGKCVETLCVPEAKSCQDDLNSQVCTEDGESFLVTPCPMGQICTVGECQKVICSPGQYYCEKRLKVQCDPYGVGWMKYSCPPGQACYEDQCEPVKQNLLVVFDTSGSMASIGFLDTVPCICPTGCYGQPFPQCEDPNCPQSKIGMSKFVFNQFFSSAQIHAVHFVLTHFPLRIKYPPALSCNDLMSMGRGWYGQGFMDPDTITGDDGSHAVADGSWFFKNLHEILAVPFPVSWDEDNLALAQQWVNFNEEVGPTEQPCGSAADCPGGFCAQDGAESVCWYHTDPELRAFGNTPLGKSLFYAGELYRTMVLPNGRACEKDEDCKNRNYYCQDGQCKDPFAHCLTNMIVLFTDGVEEPPTTLDNFFNPRIQAKRMRHGLGCDTSDDCFSPAECSGGVCQGYPKPYSGTTSYPLNTQSPWRLEDYEGTPIQVTTHVIDLSEGEGEANNKGIADDGGGTYYHADELDPDELLEKMWDLIDIKQNLLGCVPDYDYE